MSSLLENFNQLSDLIRQLEKNDSRIRSGQIPDAWRENLRIIGILKRARVALVKEAEEKEEKNEE